MLQKTLKKYKVFCKLLRNTGLALKTFVRSSEINFCKSDIDIYIMTENRIKMKQGALKYVPDSCVGEMCNCF